MANRGYITIALALALVSRGFASNPTVTATYAPVGQHYAIRFIVANTLPDENLTTFYVSSFYTVTDIHSPPQWTGSYGLGGQVLWTASPSSFIQPGQSDNRFSFEFRSDPDTVYWNVRTDKGKHYVGFLTPLLVPEPSGFLALGSGLLGFSGLIRRRR